MEKDTQEKQLPARGPLSKDDSRRCTAHLTDGSGRRCRKAAIRGGTVCPQHGGSAPQTRASARARLEALIDPAIRTLDKCMKDAEKTKEPETRRIALAAAKTVLDRTGLAAVSKIEMVEEDPAKVLAELLGVDISEIPGVDGNEIEINALHDSMCFELTAKKPAYLPAKTDSGRELETAVTCPPVDCTREDSLSTQVTDSKRDTDS